MNSMLVLDTSISMRDDERGLSRLNQMQLAVAIFFKTCLESAEIFGEIMENIGIVEFGSDTRCHLPLTRDYLRCLRVLENLEVTNGGSPLGEGLRIAYEQLKNVGPTIVKGVVKIFPRIILITDGEPDDAEEVRDIVKLIKSKNIAVVCVGVTDCDADLMKYIAKETKGMFVSFAHMEEVGNFFLEQIILTLFVLEFAAQIDKLYDARNLQQYMRTKGVQLNDSEAVALVDYLEKNAVNIDPKPKPKT